MARFTLLLAFLTLLFASCSGAKQPEFADLNPVTGKVIQSGAPVMGGALRFNPVVDKGEFIINSDISPEGTFSLSTVRTTDSKGERRPGAPAGEYNVVYTPISVDQSTVQTITLPEKIVIEAKENTLTLNLPVR